MPLRLGQQREQRMPRDGYRAVGLVERPRGLKGELKALPLTDFPERFAVGARVYIAGRARTISRVTWQKGRVYFYCEGVDDRESAERLRDELIEVPDSERPDDAGEFWYIDEIEGLRVVEVSGQTLGTVREVLQTGANDVYVVEQAGHRDVLVPALRDVIKRIDLAAGEMLVDLPDGLIPGREAGGQAAGNGRD